MAANLAQIALRMGVPAASNAFAKFSPVMLAKAKAMVAQATNMPVASVNLGNVATANGGMNAQLVAESLVKSGMPVADLFKHVVITSSAEATLMRDHFDRIQRATLAESDALASAIDKSPAVGIDAVLALEADCSAIERVTRVLGISVDALMDIKVTLDHLNLAKVANYKVLRKHGRVG